MPRLPRDGAAPRFARPLHVGAPNIGDRAAFMKRVEGALDRRWLTNEGPLVTEFEERVAAIAGVRHCIATCNGTTALQIAAHALGMTGEVIMPAFTFVATAHALTWLGLTPVFCDINESTHNLDPDRVRDLIGPRTGGILAVHMWGEPCDTHALEALAAEHGVPLLFDAAHAFGASQSGRPVGSFGAAEVFSFHATKFVHAIEGGAIATDDSGLAERLRAIRRFGMTTRDRVEFLGTNGRMDEISAAMGLTSLDSMHAFVEANLRNHDAYERGLRGIPGLRLRRPGPGRRNAQYVVIEVDPAAGLSRDELLDVLHAENVLARRYFWPGCHRLPPYADRPGPAPSLPRTDRVAGRVLVMPSGTAVSEDDATAICDIIREAVERSVSPP